MESGASTLPRRQLRLSIASRRTRLMPARAKFWTTSSICFGGMFRRVLETLMPQKRARDPSSQMKCPSPPTVRKPRFPAGFSSVSLKSIWLDGGRGGFPARAAEPESRSPQRRQRTAAADRGRRFRRAHRLPRPAPRRGAPGLLREAVCLFAASICVICGSVETGQAEARQVIGDRRLRREVGGDLPQQRRELEAVPGAGADHVTARQVRDRVYDEI